MQVNSWSIVGHTDTFMSMIVTFDSDEYAALVPDRDTAFSEINIAFYSDMPQN